MSNLPAAMFLFGMAVGVVIGSVMEHYDSRRNEKQ